MKKIYLLLCCLPVLAHAQPAGYYNSTVGKMGEDLRETLYDIIKGHTQLSYTPGLWNAYYTTDVKPDGKVWDIYSDKPGSAAPYEYTFGTNQCGNGANHENSCYNREHLWPQSLFNSNYPMESDLWIAYPTDYYVNGQRSNMPYGEVGSATKTFMNGTKIGSNTYTGAPTNTCFEPIDSFKGDIARSYFYITTRYLADSNTFSNWDMATKCNLKPWAIAMLLEWHHLDPVSTKEKNRNDAAYALQNNRNPFIDHPEFADCIWGGICNTNVSVAALTIGSNIHVYPTPAINQVTIDWQALSPDEVLAVDIINLQGQLLYHAPANQTKSLIVPVTSWAKGIYLLEVKTQHGMQAQKLIVQ